MLLSLIFGGASFEDVMIQLIITLPIVLISLTFHEVAHGYVSYKMGDPTAYNLGRLTLNPLKHLEPIGALSMLLFGIGWARPVPVNARYYKNPKRGMALTALAGPVTNLILAFIAVIGSHACLYLTYIPAVDPRLIAILYQFFTLFALMNISLAVFNLIPVPPFDGSRIAFVFLPTKFYFGIMRYERIIQMVILAVLFMGFLDVPLAVCRNVIFGAMSWLVGLVL